MAGRMLSVAPIAPANKCISASRLGGDNRLVTSGRCGFFRLHNGSRARSLAWYSAYGSRPVSHRQVSWVGELDGAGRWSIRFEAAAIQFVLCTGDSRLHTNLLTSAVVLEQISSPQPTERRQVQDLAAFHFRGRSSDSIPFGPQRIHRFWPARVATVLQRPTRHRLRFE